MIWSEVFAQLDVQGVSLLTPPFIQRWANEPWNPEDGDRSAAALMHTQIVSRIATQELGYQDGSEQAALESLFTLFGKTRDICDRFPPCRHFEALAWEVLNSKVRPFTARWHKESQLGSLFALDATDEFRAQLTTLQSTLRRLDQFLLLIRDSRPTPILVPTSSNESDIEKEMRRNVPWGISSQHGELVPAIADSINNSERDAILARRVHYGIANSKDAVALALSGGGIRSATFALGVLVSLAERNILPQIDYLSTVSGGGYLGSFLSAFLESSGGETIGLKSGQLPFLRQDGEAAALRHIRHYCKYLATGSLWQRLTMMFAQLYGMVINALSVVFMLALFVSVEHWLRSRFTDDGAAHFFTMIAVGLLAAGSLLALLTMRTSWSCKRHADSFVAVPAIAIALLLCWSCLASAHAWYHGLGSSHVRWGSADKLKWLKALAAVPIVASALTGFFGKMLKHGGTLLIVAAGVAAPLFFVGIYLHLYEFAAGKPIVLQGVGTLEPSQILWALCGFGTLIYFFVVDVNFTSPHRHYRDGLAKTFLIQTQATPSAKDPFQTGVPIRLSELGEKKKRSPYHLINCALNVPGSKDISMQGRLTDFFVFSPAFSGSPLIGYRPTREWEAADPHLDLGTAMAISGAAAAPQMGLGTKRSLSFWLVLLNIRLGYWARNPKKKTFAGAPGLGCLVQEMLGTMDERGSRVNLTDGGHIENLGVYELLRRRSKFIIAVDGEEDHAMTFSALTTLQRLAAIDFGIRIDINLDDLRLNEHGLSRSHFRFCRIHYPSDGRGSEEQIGYLLYLKLSLTGNEGEFIRRFRTDDPVFPHDSTANQLFSEAQFEAYRSLGEHVGDKLFLESIVGGCAHSKTVKVDEWFLAMGKSLLDPLPPKSP
jgi:hypothetical protein